MSKRFGFLGAAALAAMAAGAPAACAAEGQDLAKIQTVVIIYAENRSFDSVFGKFPGAHGVAEATPASERQVDRDGTPLKELPPVWGGLTAKGVTPVVTQAQTEHLPDGPFGVDGVGGFNQPFNAVTHDLWHRFYENQMQIDGGRNDKFVAWADSGAMPMADWNGSKTQLWKIAQKYTLADNFFMGAFGGSFLNHFWLVCACTPTYSHAGTSPAKPAISKVEADGVTLVSATDSPKSAMDGVPKFAKDGNLTPDFFAVNTMQPPYQPSANKPAEDGDRAYANPMKATTLPPQSDATIGDLLSSKGVSWAWYAGAWGAALAGQNAAPVPNFQYHHQPFNYFKAYAPGTTARAEHLKDGGMNGDLFIKDIDAGKLPQVAFYKPQGNLNEHSGYADIAAGDQHIADLVSHLEKSPQWPHMLVVITFDENGGLWDHVAPPKADRWGPGSRVPAVIVSPYAKKGYVDHSLYDTTSILRFITHRYQLPALQGLADRDAALKKNGEPPLGDLTDALQL